ncbi:hypothetical protein OPV22_014265 [Ensete ventricosum]|uniref:Uncharacterized protein n=1 Tax=Ensete ventricosum TaxID=4639 RepID=A0AAV8PPV4_ENSVE|nr:hypothetical protein OPV22_014265 [Ensete ventricosum]
MAITSTHDSKYALAMWESSTYLQPATLLLTRAVHAMDMLTLDRHRRTVRSPLPAPYVEATRPTLVPSFSWNTVPADPPQLCPFRWSRPRGVPAGSIDLRSMAAMRGMWIEAYLCGAAALWTTGRRRKTAEVGLYRVELFSTCSCIRIACTRSFDEDLNP